MNRSTMTSGAAATLALLGTGLAFAGAHSDSGGDPAAGKAKAEPCLACHSGQAFAGLSAETIEGAINAVVAGETPHPDVGSPSAQDVRDMAVFFASLDD